MIKETARVLLIMVLTITAGTANGLIVFLINYGARFWYSTTLILNVGVGTLLGFLACAFVVPLLWRRQITRALPIVYFVGALCAGIASLIIPTILTSLILATFIANSIGCLSMSIVSVFVHAKMPAVFDEVIPGHCSTCGYNLRGIRADRCPECGCLAPVSISTKSSRLAEILSRLRWWLVPTWISPAIVYYLCMLIPASAAVLKGLEHGSAGIVICLVFFTFLLSGVLVYFTLRGVSLRNRIVSTLALGLLLIPFNYLAIWTFIVAGIYLGFHR